MRQTRKMSLAESITNVSLGYALAILIQYIIFPWAGLHPSLGEHMVIAAIFTFASIVRSYLIRRLFNRL